MALLNCDWCGAGFTASYKQEHAEGTGLFFCSNECSGAYLGSNYGFAANPPPARPLSAAEAVLVAEAQETLIWAAPAWGQTEHFDPVLALDAVAEHYPEAKPVMMPAARQWAARKMKPLILRRQELNTAVRRYRIAFLEEKLLNEIRRSSQIILEKLALQYVLTRWKIGAQ